MKDFVNKCIRAYDVILNVVFVLLLIFTAFVICYYALPEQTSIIIAKALSYTDNVEISTTFMNYLNGFTLGAGFPLWFSQKAMVSRYITNNQNKYSLSSTKDLLGENLDIQAIQIEFQKAEALRFVNSPTMPAKARLGYKAFLDKLEERENSIKSLKVKFGIEPTREVVKEAIKKVKKIKNQTVVKQNIDSLI